MEELRLLAWRSGGSTRDGERGEELWEYEGDGEEIRDAVGGGPRPRRVGGLTVQRGVPRKR